MVICTISKNIFPEDYNESKRINFKRITMKKLLMLIVVALVVFAGCEKITGSEKDPDTPATEIVVCPAPADEALSTLYTVTVDGMDSPVYKARTDDTPFADYLQYHGGEYGFSMFSFGERAITVRIRSAKDLSNVVIRPESKNVQHHMDKGDLVLQLSEPMNISIEPDGKNNPLLLFANPLEVDVPAQDNPSVIYFGPGIHRNKGEIWVRSNQTVYIAGGAIVEGSFIVRGDNVKIKGRGIICQNRWGHQEKNYPINFAENHENLSVEGIVIRGSCHWTIALLNGDKVSINNVKICGGRVKNDDGIAIVNSSNVNIENCFIRTFDDCIALKGINAPTITRKNVEHIGVKNCVLWGEMRVFFLGWESDADYFRDIRVDNIDVIHYFMPVFQFEPRKNLVITDVDFNNIRINGTYEGERLLGDQPLIEIVPKLLPEYEDNIDVNHFVNVDNVTFKNIFVNGKKGGGYKFKIYGPNEMHRVENVSFENVILFNERVTETSGYLNIGEHTTNITFK